MVRVVRVHRRRWLWAAATFAKDPASVTAAVVFDEDGRRGRGGGVACQRTRTQWWCSAAAAADTAAPDAAGVAPDTSVQSRSVQARSVMPGARGGEQLALQRAQLHLQVLLIHLSISGDVLTVLHCCTLVSRYPAATLLQELTQGWRRRQLGKRRWWHRGNRPWRQPLYVTRVAPALLSQPAQRQAQRGWKDSTGSTTRTFWSSSLR
mmetsp:Transcript_19675/g.48754  ORF Transcript_19675/g.48754 Transcript_19675/m.48754 type:complete len:207 (+) Transcript_19675:687-1307(+)